MVGDIAPVAEGPAARDTRLRAGSSGGYGESVDRHVMSATLDQGAGAPRESV